MKKTDGYLGEYWSRQRRYHMHALTLYQYACRAPQMADSSSCYRVSKGKSLAELSTELTMD
jgi:hypothetical protein